MRKLLGITLFVLAFAVGASAQGTTPTPISVGTVNCGRTTLTTLNCYSVPITIGGNTSTAWFDVQGQGGFILFRPNTEGTNYYTAAIQSVTVNSRNTIGQPTSVTITFQVTADPNNDNDADVVLGSVTLNATYAPNNGRYGGYVMTITGGSGAQSIAQD